MASTKWAYDIQGQLEHPQPNPSSSSVFNNSNRNMYSGPAPIDGLLIPSTAPSVQVDAHGNLPSQVGYRESGPIVDPLKYAVDANVRAAKRGL